MTVQCFAPSLLSANSLDLTTDLSTLSHHEVMNLHVDVMDGYFVPNTTFGRSVIQKIYETYSFNMMVHLMVNDVPLFIDYFIDICHEIAIHIEQTPHIHRVITDLQARGKRAGVAINPGTPLSALTEILPLVDFVLVMTVNPGFGGQIFLKSQMGKVKHLAAMREKDKATYSFDIVVDGGVNRTNAQNILDSGADLLIVGHDYFSHPLKASFDFYQNLNQRR